MTRRKILWPIFSFIILLSILLTLVSFLATKSTFVENKVEQTFKNILESNFDVQVEVSKTEGNILTGYTFYGITLFVDDSIKIGASESISIEFNPFALLKRQKIIERILINRPSFDFIKTPPQKLIKKKEKVEEEKKEDVKPQGIAIKNVSIIRGNITLNYRERTYELKNINMDGSIYLSSLKNRIILRKCNVSLPSVTIIKSFTGTIIFKDGCISLLDCSLKTKNSLLSFNGNLFDEHKGLSIDIKLLSLDELSKLILSKEELFQGKLKGRIHIRGKGKDLEAYGNLSVSRLFYKEPLGEISCNLSLGLNKLNIKNLLWKAPQGNISMRGTYNLEDKSFSFKTNAYELTLDNTISKLLNKNWHGRFSGEISVNGRNIDDPVRREIEIKAQISNSFVNNLSIDSVNIDLLYCNRTINLREMEIYRQENWINIRGTFGKNRKVYVKSNNFHITPLLELIGINDIRGHLTMEGRYEEKEGQHIIQAKIDCKKPGFKNIQANHLRAMVNFNIPDKNSHLIIKDIDFFNTHLDSLTTSIISDTIIRSFSLLAEGKDLYLNSMVSVETKNGNLSFVVDTIDLRYKNAEIRNKEKLKIEIEKDVIRLEDGLLFLTEIPILISLEINKSLNYIINMSSDSLDLRIIAGLLQLDKDMGGTLGFEISGQGSLKDPKINLNIIAKNVFLEEMHADKISGSLSYLNDEIHIKSLTIEKRGEISEVKAIIPLTILRKKKDRTRRIEFHITANDLGGWIFYPFNRFCHYEGGKVYGTVRGMGTVGKLDITGDLRIYSTNLYIPFLGIRLRNTEGLLQLSKEEVTIKKVKGSVGDGFLQMNGKLKLQGIKPESIDLSISGNHIPFAGFKDIYLIVNPKIELKGPFSKLHLLGSINIEKGEITIPFRREQEKGIRSGNISYDLEITAEEGNIWLKNEDADVELKGNIFAKGTGNAPQLSGFFETKRGFIFYLDKTFTIEKGLFRFTNAPELNPEIDLKAQTKVHYKDTTAIVYLNVGGTMQQPEFMLTSSNPSLTEENIILLLSFGVTSLEDITSLANVSALPNIAAGYWIRQTLLREFQSTLGIDAIDLETRFLGSQKTAKLTVGKYISKDLYLGVTHDIFATSKDEFEIEYKLLRGSYIIGERNDEGRYSLGVRFKFKY